ncbi:MAG: hypothetical protein IT564_06220 [Rhodospirillales bacterium]|nr:hypothetical protein [Rhodospirillales bacterium]
MANRAAVIGLAAILPAVATPAFADDAFTLRCRVTETEKIDSGDPAARGHVFAATLDLSARKFYVFEDSSRKYHSGRIEAISAVEAGSVRLTAPSEFHHGTEHMRASGLILDLRTLVLREESILKDGRMTIETAWSGVCERTLFRPLSVK